MRTLSENPSNTRLRRSRPERGTLKGTSLGIRRGGVRAGIMRRSVTSRAFGTAGVATKEKVKLSE